MTDSKGSCVELCVEFRVDVALISIVSDPSIILGSSQKKNQVFIKSNVLNETDHIVSSNLVNLLV